MALDEGDILPDLRRLEGDYESIRELGRGAMTAVYLARHRGSGALVAIKAVRGWYRRDATATERFAREARTAARLEHPNIVRTLAVESLDDDAIAIVSRYVEGGTLREALRINGAFPVQRAERVLRDMAAALAFAHDQGVVHRDVKPENIFLDRASGRALLSDFGIARSLDGDSPLTAVGSALGTPTYMSPEQIDGLPADGRSDIYSLGVVGWELLSGVKPWAGESLYSVIYKQKREQLPRLTTFRDDIPTPLLYAVEGALQKDRGTRWAHVDEFLAQLDERPATPWVVPPEAGRAQSSRSGSATPASTPIVAAPAARVPTPVSTPVVPGTPPRADAEAPASPPPLATPVRPAAPGYPAATVPAPMLRRRPRRSVLVGVPLALAAVAALALVNDRQNREEAARTASFNDSLSVIASGGETAAPRDSTPPARSTRATPAAAAAAAAAARRDSASAPRATPRPPAAAPAQTPRPATPARTTPTRTPVRTPARDTALPAPPRPTTPRPASTEPPAAGAASRTALRTHEDSLARCRSTGAGDQATCLRASLADADRVLNRTYAALIADYRRRAGVRAGADDPPIVDDLRVDQRSWMVIRDRACQQEARPSIDGVWAPARVQCLARHADRRASELESMRARLRGG